MTSQSPALGIAELPSEVVLDHLLPALDLPGLAALSKVNRHFHDLGQDETFWRQKTLRDFSYSPSALALDQSAPSGWSQRVYMGLRQPSVFLWGSQANGRMGGASDPRLSEGVIRHQRMIDTPAELVIPSDDVEGGAETEDEGGVRNGRTFPVHLRDSLALGYAGLQGGVKRDGKRVGIVDLQAGGWSFTARDMNGGIWVWGALGSDINRCRAQAYLSLGQLDGTMMRLRAASWDDKYCQCPEPTRIPLPCRAEAMSSGRQHLLILDSDNLIWELRSWGRAYHHTAIPLTSPSHPGTSPAQKTNHIIQLSTGWSHSACLTSTGNIHLWFPFSRAYEETLTPEEDLNGPLGVIQDDDEQDTSRAVKWGIVGGDAIFTLEPPSIKPVWDGLEWGSQAVSDTSGSRMRQDLEDEWDAWRSSHDDKTLKDMERVVKIASGLDFILALKASGEVWCARVKEGAPLGIWEYLPYFSSPSISHISAQFETITAYSTPPDSRGRSITDTPHPTSTVLHARLPENMTSTPDFGASLKPEYLPDLQSKGVIQVAIGDYHYAALTSGGEVWTWGQGHQGQLGLGRRDGNGTGRGFVDKPEKVVFPGDDDEIGDIADDGGEGKKSKKRFVFAITAAGWHTGALVLGDPDAQVVKTSRSAPKPVVPSRDDIGPMTGEGGMPGAFPGGMGNGMGHGVFRVGFAGRGGFPGGSSFARPSRGNDEDARRGM